ncbi:MAG: D-alanyl-D-alanine carboxypeptidase family protein, partial [Pseudomonadota bacterium]
MIFARMLAIVAVALGLLAAPASAGPALLFDGASGKVLYHEDQDHQWYPASLTKIMTAYLTFEAIKSGRLALDSKIVCSETANLQPPSKVGLPVGAEMTVELGLKALIVKSANDVAVMLAEAVAGSEAAFVERMNATASRLGMTRTHFANPNGLPAPDQVTTARDLAKLSMAVLRDFPEHAHYWSMPNVQIGKLRLGTHNSLLKTFEGADGLKTGFICDSGFNVVASATRDGTRLMAVVLGEPTGHDRSLRAASLLEHGFQQYGWKTLFSSTSVDNLPLDADAKGPASVRASVLAWDCGHRPHRSVVKRSAKVAAGKAKPAAQAAAGAMPAKVKSASSTASAAATKPSPQAKKPSP